VTASNDAQGYNDMTLITQSTNTDIARQREVTQNETEQDAKIEATPVTLHLSLSLSLSFLLSIFFPSAFLIAKQEKEVD